MKQKRLPLIIILTLVLVLQGALGLTAFAADGTGGGKNLPHVTEYGVYCFDPESNLGETTVAQGTVVKTGNDGVIYNIQPWTTLTNVPYVFENNAGIGIKFAVNVIPEAHWIANQACFHMYDDNNNSVAINVNRLGTVYDGTNGNRNYIFVVPQEQLQPDSTYKITIDASLTANNGNQAGKQQEVFFTTSPAPASSSVTLSAGNVSGAPGAMLQVPVILSSLGEVVAMQFDLSYDSNLLTYQQTKSSSLTSEFAIASQIMNGNKVRVVIYNTNNTPVTTGSGSVAQLQFQVAAAATVGQTCALELSEVILADAQSNAITTTVNNGQFTVLQPTDNSAPVWINGSLAASNVSKNSLTLTWSGASDNIGVTGYNVYQGTTLLTSTPVTGTSYSVTGLTAGTVYSFKVEAGNAAGYWSTNGPSTETKTAPNDNNGNGDGNIGGGGADKQAPTWPNKTFKTATKTGDDVTLSWYAANDNVMVTGYKIYHAGEQLGSVNGNTTTFTYSGASGTGTGSLPYCVQAVDAAGNESIDGPCATIGGGGGGKNLPLIIEYGFYKYDPNSTTNPLDVVGERKTYSPWIIKQVPCTFANHEAIGVKFVTNVSTDNHFNNNKAIIKMLDASNKSVKIYVDRAGDGSPSCVNKDYLFVIPQVTLEPGSTYKIIIGPTLTSNNGMQAGEEQVVEFTTSGSPVTSPVGGSIVTEGPTYTNGSGTVEPDVGATVGLNDMAKVVIPADALEETRSVKVSVKKVTSPPTAPAGIKVVGDVYEFSVGDKNSYSFTKKVALTFKLDTSKIDADELPAIHYYDETQKKWVNIGGTVSGSTITVQVEHFTKYTVFAVKKAAVPEQPTVPVDQPKLDLNDIAGHWAQSNIEKLVGLGAISGYPDGSFKPGKTITRAEFATILAKAFKITASSGKSFTDTAGHWAEEAITTAAAVGIVKGYDADTFGPNDLVTREQMAAMIVNAAKLAPSAGEIQFTDSGTISKWALQAVATAINNGVMKGYPDNKFLPKGNATRAEAVTVIVNALK